LAIKYLVQAIGSSSHSNERGFGINISRELALASKGNIESKAIKRKDEVERIAVSAR
jgi:ribosomal protein S7